MVRDATYLVVTVVFTKNIVADKNTLQEIWPNYGHQLIYQQHTPQGFAKYFKSLRDIPITNINNKIMVGPFVKCSR